MTAAASLAFALLLVAPTAGLDSPGPPPPPVQPAVYRSASGRFDVRVDPSARGGGGLARVELARKGEPLWSQEWPFTPLEVVVSERGVVVGLGHESVEVDGWRTSRARVRIASLAGAVLADEALQPQNHRATRGAGLCLMEGMRRAVVRFEWRGDRWWMFDLESGARLFDGDPAELQPRSPYDLRLRAELHPETLSRVMDLVALEGTPLFLAQWAREEEGSGRMGTRYALLDALLRPVWILEERGELGFPYFEERNERRFRVLWSGVHALPGPSTFEVLVEGGAQVARFEAERDARAPRGWAVRELERRPWQPKAVHEVVTPPRLELEWRGSVRLRAPGAGRARALAVGPDGRLFVQDEETDDVHVFSRDGLALRVLRAKPGEFARSRRVRADLLVDGEGELYVQRDGPMSTWSWFDAGGKRVGPLELGDTAVAFQLASPRRWTFTNEELRLRERDGTVSFETQRRPDGRWLQLAAAGCAPDGSLVALSAWSDYGGKASGRAHWYGPDVLCWYAPDGTPGRVLELPRPSAGRGHRLLVACDWIVLAGWRARLELVRNADGERFLFGLDEPMPRTGAWDPALSPERDELWWLDGGSWIVQRFALPR